MAVNIGEVLAPKEISVYWNDNERKKNRPPYLGAGLFPPKKQMGLKLSFLIGSGGLPVSLMPSAFDAKATFRDREGFKLLETKMPFFKEAKHVSEEDRQQLLMFEDAGVPYAKDIIDRLFDDVGMLIEGALVVPERMIMSLLFAEDGNAGINFTANGVSYAYNYDPNGTWKANNYTALASNYWDDPDASDPLADLLDVINGVRRRTGSRAGAAIMNERTFSMLSQSKAIRANFMAQNVAISPFISAGDVRRLLSDKLDLRNIVVYDNMYKNESGETVSFVPDGYVAVVPSGPLGYTHFGSAPDEASFVANVSDAKVEIVETGIAITQKITIDPVNINTIASMIVLPSWERMDECALLKVIA